MTVSITTDCTTVALSAPYTPELPKAARRLGGEIA